MTRKILIALAVLVMGWFAYGLYDALAEIDRQIKYAERV